MSSKRAAKEITSFVSSDLPTENNDRVVIKIQKGRLAEVVDQAEQVLLDRSANAYLRGEILMRVIPNTTQSLGRSGVNRQRDAPVIVPHTAVSLSDDLNRLVSFHKWNVRNERWQPTDCPKDVSETMLSRMGMLRLPRLTAVINGATLRPDGTVLSTEGYDNTTGFLVIEGFDMPHNHKAATRKGALEALAILAELLDEFPFVGDCDRSVALALLLTAIVRPSLPTAPMFAITAPSAGTGKSYLADLAAVLATGRRAAVVGASCGEDELEKRLGASLMAGDAVQNLDNLDRTLKSERLCQVLSQETVKFRILGRSTNVDTPTKALMIATGNALRVHGDLTRRVLLIHLDAVNERPELRNFRRDPVKMAIAEREKYLAAALTVLRAFVVSGDPSISPTLGSFGQWSDLVRSALVWLGCTDPTLAMEAARNADPERERTAEILTALLPEETWTVRELAQRLSSGQVSTVDLRDVLAGFMRNGQLDRHALGNWCAKHQNRPVNGMTLCQAGLDKKAKVKRWRVESS